MNKALKIFQVLRFTDWWQYKVAPLAGFIYLMVFWNQYNLAEAIKYLLLLMVVIIGFAGVGHIINDFYDKKVDERAGKINRYGQLKSWQQIALLMVLLSMGFLPWAVIQLKFQIAMLLILQLLLYVAYSHPYIRLKEKHFWGVLCDALYGHAIPVVVVIMACAQYQHINFHVLLFLLFTFGWSLFKGFRNILLHQLDDRKNDQKVGLTTFPVKFKPLFTLNLINRIVLPFEFLVFCVWLFLLSESVPFLWIWFLVFLVFTYLKFSGWHLWTIPYRQLKFKFLFFLNDFYEQWLPVIFGIYMIAADLKLLPVLILHFLLFFGLMKMFLADLKLIRRNLSEFIPW